jgi:hypothetical protein
MALLRSQITVLAFPLMAATLLYASAIQVGCDCRRSNGPSLYAKIASPLQLGFLLDKRKPLPYYPINQLIT